MTAGTVILLGLILVVIIVLLKTAVVVPQKSAYLIERLGKFANTLGAGFHILVPFVDRIAYRHTLKEEARDVPPQSCITRDNVSITVDGILYLQVMDPVKASYGISDYRWATIQLAQTTMRSIIGQAEMDELLAHREKINESLATILDQQTEPWGIKVSNVEVKDVDLPQEMQRAMAKQAEAEREKRAKIIHAEGEFLAATNLAKAAAEVGKHPITLQLRYLQTLTEIAAEKNSTIVFPLPIDLIKGFLDR